MQTTILLSDIDLIIAKTDTSNIPYIHIYGINPDENWRCDDYISFSNNNISGEFIEL